MTDTRPEADERTESCERNSDTNTPVQTRRHTGREETDGDGSSRSADYGQYRNAAFTTAYDACEGQLRAVIADMLAHATADLREQLAEAEARVERLKHEKERRTEQVDYLSRAVSGDTTPPTPDNRRTRPSEARANKRDRSIERAQPRGDAPPSGAMVWHGHREHNCVLVHVVEQGLGVLDLPQQNNVHERAHDILVNLAEWGYSNHRDDGTTDDRISNWEIRLPNPVAKKSLERERGEELRSTQVKRAFKTIVNWAADDGCPNTPTIEKNDEGHLELVIPNVPPYAAGPPRNRNHY